MTFPKASIKSGTRNHIKVCRTKYSYIEFHDHVPKIWLTRIHRNFATFCCFTDTIKEIPNAPPEYKSSLSKLKAKLYLQQFFLSGFLAYILTVWLFFRTFWPVRRPRAGSRHLRMSVLYYYGKFPFFWYTCITCLARLERTFSSGNGISK